MADDLPYRAEYAKSGRASCKGCKGNIAKDTLRLAAMVQSPMFDGKVPHWYHVMCFFGKQRPKTVADIAHFDSLRWDDQEKIKTKLESGGGPVPTGKSGKGGKGGKGKKNGGANMDFNMEYAKSGRAMCRGCDQKIAKDEVRVSKKEFDSDRAKMYGPVDLWHHLDCFVKKRAELEFFAGGDTIPGYGTLSADDKKLVKEKLKPVEVKRKAEDEPDHAAKKVKTEEEEKMKKQNKKMFGYRDKLKTLKKKELSYLMEYNDQDVPSGESVMLDRLSDMMTFGRLETCTVCKDGCFVYQSGVGYACKGNLTEWTKCTNVTKEPKRGPFKIPKELAEAYEFLNSYKYKDIGPRIVLDRGPSSAQLEAKKENGTAAMSSSKPLEGMKFVVTGSTFERGKKKIAEQIKELGGDVVSSVAKTTAAVITTSDEVAACSKKIDQAKEHNIQCVSEDFVDEVSKGGALLMIQKKNMVPWGGDPQDRVHAANKKSGSADSMFTKSVPDKLKVKLKGGAAVDPDSGLEDCSHVYQRGSKYYNCVLGMVDIVKGTNSYYKLQVLESDGKREWYVFRSWGRVGTTVGGNKLEQMEDLNDAVRQFEGLYEEKTGNRFTAKEFTKLPNRWYPLDIDYGQDEEKISKPQVAGSKSKLDKAIQELVSLIFDVDTMKSTMVEYEIDLKKMPLGKLSKKQIEQAYLVLTDTLDVLKRMKDNPDSAPGAKAQLIDCSNRFYTLIPHDFGMKKPPILDSEDLINAKIGMLDSLSEIELAYNILKSEDDEDDKNADPIDKHYKKLKTKMEVLDKKSDEFSMVKKYVKNTHAETHNMYSLELEEVFKVERQGEKKRFKPFKQLHNRQLLWHGSRLTNFAGILSQGLRIAPPEAPVTGYMFGKGIYFADMVSKSANYCRTSHVNPTGLLMLCEVALGSMYERLRADYIEKLPSGKHSTKGLGLTHPDPSKNITIEDDIQVPLGKGVPSNVKNSSLLYNEYIVYDVAQVKAKYLLKVNFRYN